MTKKTLFYLVLVSSFIFISCSDDDGDSQDSQNDNNYFPLVIDNSWDYQNTVSSENQDDIVDQETLTVSGTNQVDGNTVYEFETSNPVSAGPTTSALSSGTVYKSGNSFIYTGSIGLGIPELPNLNFEIQDAVIYNKSANEDNELFSASGTIQESIEGVPITIDYTLLSVMGSRFESLIVNGTTFENVISSKLIVNIEVSPSDIGINLLENSEVVEVTNFFAKDVGLIKSETNTNFDFITFPSLPLEDLSFFTLQELVSYDVNLE